MSVPFRENKNIDPEFYSLEKMENLFMQMAQTPIKVKLYLKEERDYGKVFNAGIRYILETEDGQDSFWVFQVEKTFPDGSPSQVFFVGPECKVYVANVLNRLTYACEIKFSYKLTESYIQALKFKIITSDLTDPGNVKALYYSSCDEFRIHFSKDARPDESCRKAKILSACIASYQYLFSKREDRYILTNYTFLDCDAHFKTMFSKNKSSHDDLLKIN